MEVLLPCFLLSVCLTGGSPHEGLLRRSHRSLHRRCHCRRHRRSHSVPTQETEPGGAGSGRREFGPQFTCTPFQCDVTNSAVAQLWLTNHCAASACTPWPLSPRHWGQCGHSVGTGVSEGSAWALGSVRAQRGHWGQCGHSVGIGIIVGQCGHWGQCGHSVGTGVIVGPDGTLSTRCLSCR